MRKLGGFPAADIISFSQRMSSSTPNRDRQDDDQLPHQPQRLLVLLLAGLSKKNSEKFDPSTREIVQMAHPSPPNLDRIVGISTENGQELGFPKHFGGVQ